MPESRLALIYNIKYCFYLLKMVSFTLLLDNNNQKLKIL